MNADQDLVLLDRAIAQLPPALKEPLLLTVFEGLSHSEAGAELGISAKAVEGKTRRARQALELQINKWANNF
ncbi:RNA polymerase sigma factor [Erythrobacter donghaensis]|uniref:RNA polymerase sigma factor n=1 Tax=Erythrobacter donghaensis TaxID=267135 RepID=UPI0009BDB5E3|nr:sigma-70 region 4 domain-containing protein [Erythrobacter donghaensis]